MHKKRGSNRVLKNLKNVEKFCCGKFLIKHRKDIWESAIISLRQVPRGINYILYCRIYYFNYNESKKYYTVYNIKKCA